MRCSVFYLAATLVALAASAPVASNAAVIPPPTERINDYFTNYSGNKDKRKEAPIDGINDYNHYTDKRGIDTNGREGVDGVNDYNHYTDKRGFDANGREAVDGVNDYNHYTDKRGEPPEVVVTNYFGHDD